MAPLIVQIVATALARVRVSWRDAARIGLAVMFMFTAASHFSSLKYDLAAMIPPPLTGALWVIYVTGALEFAGAMGLLTRRFRLNAAWALIALLVAIFPANAYAAIRGVTIGGAPATDLRFRTPLQVFWFVVLWWSSIASIAAARRDVSSAAHVSATARINAAPARVYEVIADYRNGHPHILPKQFRNFVVEAGGKGAGTVISYEVRAFGTTRKFRAGITEAQPGRLLVESNMDGDPSITTFTVEPAEDGHASDVTIDTRITTKPGILGLMERTMSSRFLMSLYRQELALLAVRARSG